MLAAEGIDVEVIDLRTLVPPDMEMVMASVARTGRLVVAADDRPFGGFHREIQAQVVEAMPGVPTLAVGMENVPAIAQNEELEHHTAISPREDRRGLSPGARSRRPPSCGWRRARRMELDPVSLLRGVNRPGAALAPRPRRF